MIFKSQKRREKSTGSRKAKRGGNRNGQPVPFGTDHLLFSGAVLAFTGLVVLICFVGLSPAGPEILPNRIARFRVIAERTFTYDSGILTAQTREQRRRRVPPVYHITIGEFTTFASYLDRIAAELESLSEELATASFSSRQEAAGKLLDQIDPANSRAELDARHI